MLHGCTSVGVYNADAVVVLCDEEDMHSVTKPMLNQKSFSYILAGYLQNTTYLDPTENCMNLGKGFDHMVCGWHYIEQRKKYNEQVHSGNKTKLDSFLFSFFLSFLSPAMCVASHITSAMHATIKKA